MQAHENPPTQMPPALRFCNRAEAGAIVPCGRAALCFGFAYPTQSRAQHLLQPHTSSWGWPWPVPVPVPAHTGRGAAPARSRRRLSARVIPPGPPCDAHAPWHFAWPALKLMQQKAYQKLALAHALTPSSVTLSHQCTSRCCSPAQCSATALTPSSVTLSQ